MNRRSWLAGFVCGLAVAIAAWAVVETRAAGEPPAKANEVPAGLVDLNRATLGLYAGGRARELATVPAVIVVSGNDLVLHKGGTRTAVSVIPPEYHALKCVAHITLGLFTHLAADQGQPLSVERFKALQQYRDLMTAATPAAEAFGFDPDTLARQRRMIDRSLGFANTVLRDGSVTADALAKYCRESRPDIMANCDGAAKAQLVAMHRQVMAWKKAMTADEWAGLTAVIPGRQTPRAENLAVQYFARLFGERGEGRRVVYAEGLDEDEALKLLGTLRLDGRLSVAVFDDPFRMYRDILADGARRAIDDILAAP